MNRERAPQTSKRRCARTGRHGFTLVEMMVVIIVIAILAGLLLPAIGGAVRRAKNAKIALEMSQISQALERYKTEFGEYPPDFSMDDGSDSSLNRAAKRAAINQHLSRIFRYRNTSAFYPAGDRLTNADLDALNPTTALNFWLRGFSSNAQYPVTDTAAERVSLYSFDKSRLHIASVPFNAGGANVAIAIYHPAGAETEVPYVYYRADTSTDFSNKLNRQTSGSTVPKPHRCYVDAARWANATGGGPRPYFRFTTASASEAPLTNELSRPAFQYPPILHPYAAPEKFQLLCAGLDGVHGQGGIPNTDATLVLGNFPQGPYPTATHYDDRDNLTNFSEGSTLKDAQE